MATGWLYSRRARLLFRPIGIRFVRFGEKEMKRWNWSQKGGQKRKHTVSLVRRLVQQQREIYTAYRNPLRPCKPFHRWLPIDPPERTPTRNSVFCISWSHCSLVSRTRSRPRWRRTAKRLPARAPGHVWSINHACLCNFIYLVRIIKDKWKINGISWCWWIFHLLNVITGALFLSILCRILWSHQN